MGSSHAFQQAEGFLSARGIAVFLGLAMACGSESEQEQVDRSRVALTQALFYYVATNGNDDNDGSMAAPFATLERARDEIRSLKAHGGFTHPVVVNLREGTYRLDKTFELKKEDSGTATRPITYRAYPGEKAELNGGRVITGPWERYEPRIWRTHVGALRFQTLFVDRQRATRSRMPKEGFYHIVLRKHCVYAPPLVPGPDCYDRFLMHPGDVDSSWRNLSEAQVVTSHRWEQSRYRIHHIDRDQVFVQRGPFGQFFGYDYLADDRYYVDNVFEGLDEGQWYLDATSGDLYYWPKGDVDPRQQTIEVGMLTTLVRAGYGERYLSFDYLDLGASPELAFGRESFSLAAWLQFPKQGNPEDSLCQGDAWADRGYCMAHYDDQSNDTIGDSTLILNDGTHRLFVSAGPWRRESWGHFAWVVDRTSNIATSYVNGIAYHTTDITSLGDITSPLPLHIGRIVSSTGNDPANNPTVFSGDIDELRIYRRALAAGEVRSLSTKNTADNAGLALWLPFDDALNDASPAGHEIAKYGTPAFVAGAFGTGASFNRPVDPPIGFDDYVSYVDFEGLEFANTDWILPQAGYAGSQSIYVGTSPPALSLTLKNGKFENNTIAHTGANGLNLYATSTQVSNNEVVDIGGTAIQSGLILPQHLHYKSTILNGSLEVTNNRLHAVGRVFAEGPGLLFSPSSRNHIANNLVYDVNYSGISVGWFSDESMGEAAGNNLIEYNVVHDAMQGLNDGGGIYLLGWQPKTVVRHNVTHDSHMTKQHASNMLLWGLDLDGTTANITVRDNVVYRMESGSIIMMDYRYNRNNVVTNNIFIDGRQSQVWMMQAKFDEFTNNVVFYSPATPEPALFGYVAADAIGRSDENVFFTTGNLGRLQSELDAWRAVGGFDPKSIVADPLLVAHGETYTLAPESPAYSLGFIPIDPEGNGPIGVACFEDGDCPNGRCVQRQCL